MNKLKYFFRNHFQISLLIQGGRNTEMYPYPLNVFNISKPLKDYTTDKFLKDMYKIFMLFFVIKIISNCFTLLHGQFFSL